MPPDPSESIFGPALSPVATYAEREAYRREHRLPGRVDRWLISNSHSVRIAFLQDYLMLEDINGADCVVCHIERVCVMVSILLLFYKLLLIYLC